MYVFLVSFTIFDFYHEKFISTNCKNIFFYQKFVHFAKNTFIFCSWIIVVHVHANSFFYEVHPACHNIAKVLKPGNNSKAIDNHDFSKAVC